MHTLIKGMKKIDERGSVSFINEFSFKNVKRFYLVENIDTQLIRAFHGHMKEEKYVFVPSGKALVCIVPLSDHSHPSKDVTVEKFILSDDDPQILHIPGGYANGVRSLKENTKIIFFSTATLHESMQDDFRFSFDYWGKEIWEV